MWKKIVNWFESLGDVRSDFTKGLPHIPDKEEKMGGEREAYMEAGDKSKKKDTPPGSVAGIVGSTAGSRIRIHQSGGEIHFHDDANKIKCAVPVAEAWKGWEQIRCQPGRFEWVDTVNNSYLVLESYAVPPNFQLLTTLIPIQADANFSEFNNFIKRK